MGEIQHNEEVPEQRAIVFADKAKDSHHDSAKEGDEEVFARSVDWPFGRGRFEAWRSPLVRLGIRASRPSAPIQNLLLQTTLLYYSTQLANNINKLND